MIHSPIKSKEGEICKEDLGPIWACEQIAWSPYTSVTPSIKKGGDIPSADTLLVKWGH